MDSTEPKFTENAEFLYHLLAKMDEFGKTKTDILVIFTKLDRLVTHSRMILTSFLMDRLRGTLAGHLICDDSRRSSSSPFVQPGPTSGMNCAT